MGKFAAIEARASQYPASANDVVWLLAKVRALRAALQQAANDMGADDAPWYEDAIAALEALEEPNVPLPS